MPHKHRSPLLLIMSRLRRYFIAGLLFIAPLAITIFALKYTFQFLDSFPGIGHFLQEKLDVRIPGIGLILSLVLICLLGFLTTNVLGRKIVSIWEMLIGKVPVLRTIYISSKELFQAVFLPKKQLYSSVVLVEYPRKGIWVLGFVTNTEVFVLDGKKMTSIFIPTTPNPTSGVLIFQNLNEYITTDMTVEEGIKLVVSGAILTPEKVTFNEIWRGEGKTLLAESDRETQAKGI